MQIGDCVALDADRRHAERHTARRLRVNAARVIHEIRGKRRLGNGLGIQASRQLTENCGNNLKVRQLLRSQRSIGNVPMYQIRGQA